MPSPAKEWLNNFFRNRKLVCPEGGRHLYSYGITQDEYCSLGKMLSEQLNRPILGNDAFFFMLEHEDGLAACFFLYAAMWFQQNGEHLYWRPIIQSLVPDFDEDTNTMGNFIGKALDFWGLKKNSIGHEYIGAVAREAGLPIKMLQDDSGPGSVGYLIRKIYKASSNNATEEQIAKWVNDGALGLPVTWQAEAFRPNIVNCILAMREIRGIIGDATSSREASMLLDSLDPSWRDRFPFPICDASAQQIINGLLGEIVTQSDDKVGHPITARRFLSKDGWGEQWHLHTEYDFPRHIFSILDGKSPKIALEITQGGISSQTLFLQLGSEESAGYFLTRGDFSTKDRAAMAESFLHMRDMGGQSRSTACRGGGELDQDLPWIFEDELGGYSFVSQGGATIRESTAIVALSREWSIDGNAVQCGELKELGRLIWKVKGDARLSCGMLVYDLKTCSKGQWTSYEWIQEGTPGFDVLKPSLCFQGYPKAAVFVGAAIKLYRGPIKCKAPLEQAYTDMMSRGTLAGVYQVMLQDPKGPSLRNKMLLLPQGARVTTRNLGDSSGEVRLDNWKACTLEILDAPKGLCHSVTREGNDLLLSVSMDTGCVAPEYLTLSVGWVETSEPALVRVAFPSNDIRLFRDGTEIPRNSTLCIDDLTGVRLHCKTESNTEIVIHNAHGLGFRFFLGKDAMKTILLQDYMEIFHEMLSYETHLDGTLRLEVFVDCVSQGKWNIRWYDTDLFPQEDGLRLGGKSDGNRKLMAILLSHPEERRELEEVRDDNGLPQGFWRLSGLLDRPGPWLVYDQDPKSGIRPTLSTVRGVDESLDYELQRGICIANQGERSKAFDRIITRMCDDPLSREWEFLSKLLSALGQLPLPTLEFWTSAIRSPRFMAIMAMRPEFRTTNKDKTQGILSRISLELPFLWQTVSFTEWKGAVAHFKKKYREKLLSLGMSMDFMEETALNFLEDRIKALVDLVPENSLFLNLAADLPSFKPKFEQLRSIESDDYLKLFKQRSYEMKLRTKDLEIPDSFAATALKYANDPLFGVFIPCKGYRMQQDAWIGVLGLPIMLALEASTGRKMLAWSEDDAQRRKLIFDIRKNMSLDMEWFKFAFEMTCLGMSPQLVKKV